MRKKPVIVTVSSLMEILEKYLQSGSSLNYAIKILGHPGVGKSAIVKEAAEKINYHFIDTRLAFKENIDLGGYPVPDHEKKQMIYYRPRFIPPETVPEQHNGIVWFLDEANRAHPTVIQTLFQIITEHTCGEHALPDKTSIVLAGNLGEEDATTITEFDDSALDGRLAIFHLKPSVEDWLSWAGRSGIHSSVMRYISLFPERLWDEKRINPNPRGWHQVSLAAVESYELHDDEALRSHLVENPGGSLASIILSLVGDVAGNDFIMQVASPRELSTMEILSGDEKKLHRVEEGSVPSEDLLWALSGAVARLREVSTLQSGELTRGELAELANVLRFIGISRADLRMSFFYLLVRECGLFTQIPQAVKMLDDEKVRADLVEKFSRFMEN